MRTAVLAFVLGAVCSCDREARLAEQQRLDRCKMTLPILRAEPDQPYRVIQLVEAYSEIDLAWYACVEHADAVISTFTSDEVTTATVGGGPYVAAGRSRTRTEAKFIGRAIKYTPGAMGTPGVGRCEPITGTYAIHCVSVSGPQPACGSCKALPDFTTTYIGGLDQRILDPGTQLLSQSMTPDGCIGQASFRSSRGNSIEMTVRASLDGSHATITTTVGSPSPSGNTPPSSKCTFHLTGKVQR